MDVQLIDNNDNNIIQSEHYVIMRKSFKSNTCKLIKLGREKYFFFFKHKILTDSLVGQKYGSTFELTSDKTLKLVNLIDYLDPMNQNSNSNDDINNINQPKDNRFLVDNNSSQKLTRDDIEKIKKEKSGQQVIQTLVKNSATFEDKNVFSQVKYLQKKQQKYVCLVTVMKPTAKLLMEMYYSQSPSKNNYLRIDSLAQMLTLSNIMAGGKYLVVDSNLGILSASIFEKTSGNCTIVQVDMADICNAGQRQAVNALNFPLSVMEKCFSCISFNQVACLLMEKATNNNNSSENLRKKSRTNVKLQEEEEKAKTILNEQNLDALLLMSKHHDLCSLTETLLCFLSISRPFVVFSPFIEPLKECFLRIKNQCAFLRISETWLRKYQVLNDRTRPEAVMNACSGFILTGIKVEPMTNK